MNSSLAPLSAYNVPTASDVESNLHSLLKKWPHWEAARERIPYEDLEVFVEVSTSGWRVSWQEMDCPAEFNDDDLREFRPFARDSSEETVRRIASELLDGVYGAYQALVAARCSAASKNVEQMAFPKGSVRHADPHHQPLVPAESDAKL